jgi:DNA ligase-1
MKPENVKYTNMFVTEVLDKLRATTSTLDKKAILAEAIPKTPMFKEFLLAVFNPHVQYFIKKIPEYKTRKDQGEYPLSRIFKHDLLKPLYTRARTGKEGIKYLTQMLEDLDPRDAKALEHIILRDLRCGTGVDLINKVHKNLIPVFPCMLCTPYDDDLGLKFPFPAVSQLKCDGLRAAIIIDENRVEVKSRKGLDLNLGSVFDFLPAKIGSGLVLDGEILVRDPSEEGKFLPRKIGNGIINKCSKGTATEAEKKQVVMIVFDIIRLDEFKKNIPWNVPYAERFKMIDKLVKKASDSRLELVETRIVGSMNEAKQHFTNVVERGLEGTILKTVDGIWKDGRPNYQLKLKLENECDLLIKGVTEGKGKYKGKLGTLDCVSADGLLSVSVSGMTDEERDTWWKNKELVVGHILAVKYNEKITNAAGGWSLFLPRIIEIRTDKDTADNLGDIK